MTRKIACSSAGAYIFVATVSVDVQVMQQACVPQVTMRVEHGVATGRLPSHEVQHAVFCGPFMRHKQELTHQGRGREAVSIWVCRKMQLCGPKMMAK